MERVEWGTRAEHHCCLNFGEKKRTVSILFSTRCCAWFNATHTSKVGEDGQAKRSSNNKQYRNFIDYLNPPHGRLRK